jgi:FkbM family methyltransferase
MNRFSAKAELEKLLYEDMTSVLKREQCTFDEMASPFSDALVLFGAGNLGKKTLAGLRRVGIEPLAFTDNNQALWGQHVDGVPVFSPRDAATKFAKRAAFVITIWRGEGTDRMPERRQQLTDLGCSSVVSFVPLFWKYPDVFLPHYALDLPQKVYQHADEVQQAFLLWEDDASRVEYLAELRWRMLSDFDGLPLPVRHKIYFPVDLVRTRPDEVFVDCGAFDGDSIRSFLNDQGESFGQIIALEPDAANFLKLEQYVSQLPPSIRDKIVLYPFAVGAQRGKVHFEATGTEASSVGSGTSEIECIALDEILSNAKSAYIKMDIEGSELDALAGSRRLIESASAVLAVCVYHRQDHVWRIPLIIREMSDQYRFFLRPHLLEGWDLVCYAVPAARLEMRG